MSSRKRHTDDDIERSSKRRKATSDQAEIEARLESLITRVGEKSTSSLESNLEGLAGVLEADLNNYKMKIMKILRACAAELPEKVTVYSTLVGLLNAKNSNAGAELLEILCKDMRDFMKAENWCKALRVVRFISDLVNCHVVNPASIIALYEAFLSVTDEEDSTQARQDYFVYCVMSSLPWSAQELSEKKGTELEKILNTIDKYLRQRKKDHVSILKVWESDTPHPQQDYLDCLWLQLIKMRKEGWMEKVIPRPYLAFHDVLSEAHMHLLSPFAPPPHTEESMYPMPQVVFRLFEAADCPEGPSLPGPHSMDRFLIEDTLYNIIEVYHFDRKECATQLMGYQAKTRFPLTYMIVECTFGQLLRLPNPERLEAYYACLFLELCKLVPGAFPQVLAQATEMIYERLGTMNLSCMERFITWFSHHLSNFQFRWSWDEWADSVAMEPEDLKPTFIREVLLKCLRLSYHQRIAESLPEKFEIFVPSEPIPIFRYIDDGENQAPGLDISRKLILAFKSKSSPEAVSEILKECPGPPEEESMEEKPVNPLKIDVFVQSLLYLGSKSFSHSFSALAKFHPVLKELGETEESQIFILRSIRDLWQNHFQMICVLVDKLIRTQIVSCPAVINWLLSEHMRMHFTQMFVWEILHSTLNKMNKQVQKLEQEVEDIRDSEQRSKDDDNDSDEDDQYEMEKEAISSKLEQLQESLESAQSEQKNLFLIIFQRFIIILSEHIVSSEQKGNSFDTPWFKCAIQRLQQIFLKHYTQVMKYTNTLENLLFTGDIDPNILRVFQQFCSLRA